MTVKSLLALPALVALLATSAMAAPINPGHHTMGHAVIHRTIVRQSTMQFHRRHWRHRHHHSHALIHVKL